VAREESEVDIAAVADVAKRAYQYVGEVFLFSDGSGNGFDDTTRTGWKNRHFNEDRYSVVNIV
jgi:hypothetical protein